MYYDVIASAFGELVIIWREAIGKARVYRIFLPRGGKSFADFVQNNYGDLKQLSCPVIEDLS